MNEKAPVKNSDQAAEFQHDMVLPLHESISQGGTWPQALLCLVAGWTALVAVFWGTAWSMVEVWSNSVTYNHGFLILPLSVFLAWRRRVSLRALHPVPAPGAILLVAFLSVGWLLGRLGSAQVIEHFTLVAMMAAFAWMVLGSSVAWRLRMPLALLFFAVPFGDGIVAPLQDYTAAFTVKALELSSVPVYWEGRFLTVPSGTWEVAESCSGIRYLLASMVFGFVYADVTYRSWVRRLLFVVCCAVAPIVANGFRAYSIVMIGHLSNNRLAVGVDHLIYGWVFFGLVIGIMGWVGEYWREPDTGDLFPADTATLEPQTIPRTMWVATIACLVGGLLTASVGPIWAHVSLSGPLSVPETRLGPALMDAVSSPWRHQEQPTVDGWHPHSPNAWAETQQTFVRGSDVVRVYLAWYPDQQGSVEAVSSQNKVVNLDEWRRIGDELRSVVVDHAPAAVHEVLAVAPAGPRVVWTWYWIDGRFTANSYYAKVVQVLTRMSGKPSQGAVLAVSAPFKSDPTEGRVALQDFLDSTTVERIFLVDHS